MLSARSITCGHICARQNAITVRRFYISPILSKTATNTPAQITVDDELPSGYYEKPRISPVGIQHLSSGLQSQLFRAPNTDEKITNRNAQLIKLSHKHLADNELLGKKCSVNPPINFKLPKLQGKTLDEHFHKLGSLSSQKYLDLIDDLIHSATVTPIRPEKWEFKSGWTRYQHGQKPVSVPYPLEDAIVFDVETLYKISQYPILATAYTPKAWYGWVSPFLTGESGEIDNHLIPMDTHSREKIIVGHNISYDRARILDEYNLQMSQAFFLDTMSFHVAVSGMCSRQRGSWLKYKKKRDADEGALELDEIRSSVLTPGLQHLLGNSALDVDQSSPDDNSIIDDPWMKQSSLNSLAHVAEFHTGMKLSKDIRNTLDSDDPSIVIENFQDYMNYCAGDVWATFKVFDKIFPQYKKLIPHPVSFAALRHITQSFLPVTENWDQYITKTEQMYQNSLQNIETRLHEVCEEVLKLKDDPSKPWESDPWLSQLDWTVQPLKLKKNGEPYKNQKLPGYPEWYKALIIKGKLKLTTKSRISALLLKLEWEQKPIYWIDIKGWCFLVDKADADEFKKLNYIHYEDDKLLKEIKEKEASDVLEAENTDNIEHDSTSVVVEDLEKILKTKSIFKVPHENGPSSRTTNLMAKSFINYFEKGILSSKYKMAEEALKQNVSNSYWTSSRERITNQFVVYSDKNKVGFASNIVTDSNKGPKRDLGIIIPQIVPMGTVTRRAVEKTWLTASNAKKTRLGSELKSMVEAPPGYCFVGADVDSEELWIASLVGDSVFKLHGGTAIGWMTLEGAKSEGTDLHSKTANILGISRNEAKVFNYGRIYGAGVKFATTLLKKFNPNILDSEASETAKKLYVATKGSNGSLDRRKKWYGGSESIVFNRLEQIADQQNPKTPALGAGITSALQRKNLNANSFLPSRINWAIQSSGVDYLHLLLVSVEYLAKIYGLDMRLFLTVHDEVRYMAKSEDRYKAAMVLQIANLWTRAIFCQQLGIDEVPQSCAFFSAVDIDHVLRKEVDLPCITPSHPEAIPPGESLDIYQLLEKQEIKEFLNSGAHDIDLSGISYKKKSPPMGELDEDADHTTKMLQIQLQIATAQSEFNRIKKTLLNYKDEQDKHEFTKEYLTNESFNEPVVCEGTFGQLDIGFDEMIEAFKKVSVPFAVDNKKKVSLKGHPVHANIAKPKIDRSPFASHPPPPSPASSSSLSSSVSSLLPQTESQPASPGSDRFSPDKITTTNTFLSYRANQSRPSSHFRQKG